MNIKLIDNLVIHGQRTSQIQILKFSDQYIDHISSYSNEIPPNFNIFRYRHDNYPNPRVCGPRTGFRTRYNLDERSEEGLKYGRRHGHSGRRVLASSRSRGDGARSAGAQLLQEVQVRISPSTIMVALSLCPVKQQ